MPDGLSPERDIPALQRQLDAVFEGLRSASEMLSQHANGNARLTAINFPLEEGVLREAAGLLTGWALKVAALLRRLDTMTADANLHFERLFDDNAGRPSKGFLRRRVHAGNPTPEATAAVLVKLLSISAAVDRMLKDARPVLAGTHRDCEDCVLRMVVRRRRVDADLEDVSHPLALLKEQAQARQTTVAYGRSLASDAAADDERRTLALERRAADMQHETLQSERETLLRMIADAEDCVEALNAGVASVNVMAAKLGVDTEQRAALFSAVDRQSSVPMAGLPAPVQALMAAFDADILAGHDLLARKRRADDAFSRLSAGPRPSSEAAADETEAPGAAADTAPPAI